MFGLRGGLNFFGQGSSRWEFDWGDKAQCFWSARRIGAVWFEPRLFQGFHICLLCICLEILFSGTTMSYPGQPFSFLHEDCMANFSFELWIGVCVDRRLTRHSELAHRLPPKEEDHCELWCSCVWQMEKEMIIGRKAANVRVCVCVWERERERGGEGGREGGRRERERERERVRASERSERTPGAGWTRNKIFWNHQGHSTDHTLSRLLLLQFHAKCAIVRLMSVWSVECPLESSLRVEH